MQLNELPQLLTIRQACELLSCHPNTLRSWEKTGVIRSVRFGVRKDRRFPKAEVLRLLDKDQVTGESLERIVLPSDYDLTRIDMTATHFDGLKSEVLDQHKGYKDLDSETINHFDFKGFLKDQVSRIQYFEQHELRHYPTTEEKILHIITSNRYRNGSLETINLEKYGSGFLDQIRYWMSKNEPITFMLPAFPFKIGNPLKSSRGEADLAEVAALCRFNEINLQIQKVYKPGAKIVVFHDGHLYHKHFLHDEVDASRYFASLKHFIVELGLGGIVILKDAFKELEHIKEFPKIYDEARKEITNLWRKEKRDSEKIQTIIQASKNNIKLSAVPFSALYKVNFAEDWDLTKEEKKLKKEINQRAEKCAFEYMVVQHALEKAQFFYQRVPHGIRLTVHPKEGHIGISLVKRKTHLLPWMGVGVLKNNGELSVHYESELISSGKYAPVFVKGEQYPFYYKEAETIYQGESEFQRLFDSIVTSLNKGDVYWAFAFDTEYMDAKVKRILLDAHTRIALKGIEDKALCRKEFLPVIEKAYSANANIQLKAVQKDIPTGIIILKDRIINLLWADIPAAYEVKTKEVVARYQKYFKELWEES